MGEYHPIQIILEIGKQDFYPQFETPYNNYYGAIYLNTDLSIWLSVDPMSDKYPHLTSYNYCANNPVMLIDPNGKEMWEPQITSGGKVSYVAEKGDNKETFQSQYGLNAKQTDGIFKGAGIDNRQIAQGTTISGDAVKNVTGSDILKLDTKSKQATPQRFVYQAMFGVLHNKLNHSNITDMSDYINLEGSTGANNNRVYNGIFKIPLPDGEKMYIPHFNSSFSNDFSNIITEKYNFNYDGNRSRLFYTQYPAGKTGIYKLLISFPNIYADKFEKTYYK